MSLKRCVPDRSARNMAPEALLSVQGLRVGFGGSGDVLHGIDFDLLQGEILGIVGESGSGKSVTCRAMMGLLPKTARIHGRMRFSGQELSLSQPDGLARLRGHDMAMIFQDPMSALDPLMRIRRQFALRGLGASAAEDLLSRCGLPDPGELLDSYPHRMSGGQCQRVAIACALARRPRVLVADEPTTALDVTVQARLLHELRSLARDDGMSIVLVTHDLGVVAETCDRVLVMHQGQLIESGRVHDVLRSPRAAYTRELLGAIPRAERKGKRLITVQESRHDPARESLPLPPVIDPAAEPVLRFHDVRVEYPRSDGTYLAAVDDVSLEIYPREIVGIVGESGSGKSTLAKTAVGLVKPSKGHVDLDGRQLDWETLPRRDRRLIQYIFQDPRGALDPLRRAVDQVREVLDLHAIGARRDREALARQELMRAGLEATLHERRPARLSGGQRQRVTIARALALKPRVLICDESVSALDVSVQARILNTLLRLRAESDLTILFISHDLSVIHHLCDRVAVMRQGQILEQGETSAVWNAPRATYTRTLLASLPRLPEEAQSERIPA